MMWLFEVEPGYSYASIVDFRFVNINSASCLPLRPLSTCFLQNSMRNDSHRYLAL